MANTIEMPAAIATLHTACNRMVVSAEQPETYQNEGAQRNGIVRRRSGSAGYSGSNEARGKQW